MNEAETEFEVPAPRQNPDLRGQAEAESILAAGLASGKLAHAWMLTGPKGIGKATLAFRFARHILAEGAQNGEQAAPSMFGGEDFPPPAAGLSPLYLPAENSVFQRVAAGGHSDLLTVERGLNSAGKQRSDIVAGDIREVNRFLNLTAGEGGWRVVIIDSADDMNVNAANALLKVLEEPPPHALLLLVCHNPGRMLATIRSRCRVLRLAEISGDTVAELLAQYMPDMGADIRQDIAALAGGSIGRAMELAESGGAELQRKIIGFLAQMPDPDIAELQQFGAELAKADALTRFETTAELIRRAISSIVRHASGAGQHAGSDDELLARLGAAGGLEQWLQLWEKADDLLNRTSRINLDRKQVILNIFLNIAQTVRGA